VLKVGRAVNPEVVVGYTVGLTVSRPVKVITTIEKLEAAIMGINNFSGYITPGLDIVDGNSARFLVWLLPVTRCY
jgi:UDP-3-O-acyl-N-acetylglucosamine deacetylase